MKFAEFGPFPNSCNTFIFRELGIKTPETSVKITLDDGLTTISFFDGNLTVGRNMLSLDMFKKTQRMHRISYTVKPPDAPVAKTVYTYLFVSK